MTPKPPIETQPDSLHDKPGLDYRRIEVVEPQMAAILRGKSLTERLQIVQQAHRAARSVIAMGVRIQYPIMLPAAVDEEVSRRLLRGTG